MVVNQQQNQQGASVKKTPCSVTLQVADRLNKYIDLPPRPHFKVNDVLQRGPVFTFIRSKSSSILPLPDHVSRLKSRLINVTSTGFMIIYETDSKGLVVDLRRVLNVFCNADRFVQKAKKVNYLRCHIKIRLPRGNIHMFVRDENVHKWTCAIMRASGRPSPLKKTMKMVSEVEMMTALEEEEVSSLDEAETMTSSLTTCETCVEKEVDPEEYSEDEDIDEEDDEDTVVSMVEVVKEPLAQTTSSVRSLRQKLERNLKLKPKEQVMAEQQQKRPPQFVSELFYQPENSFGEQTIVMEPTDEEEKKEMKEHVEREKTWWTRSLRC